VNFCLYIVTEGVVSYLFLFISVDVLGVINLISGTEFNKLNK
jgi:hypothetical protein